MNTNNISISGVYTLDEKHVALLEAMDLEVPATMNATQLRELIRNGRQHTNENFHEVISPMVLSVLSDLELWLQH